MGGATTELVVLGTKMQQDENAIRSKTDGSILHGLYFSAPALPSFSEGG